jgi:hypothetical protein
MKQPKSIVRKALSTAYALVVAAATALLAPAAALAQEEVIRDARLEGYETNIFVENDSTALTWLFFVLLGVLALIGFFKNAKRTHLD